MRVFMDSSALAKRYIEEPGWPRVHELLLRADELLISVIAYPEVVAALCRRRREGTLTDDQYQIAKRRAASDFNDAMVVGIDADVMRRTILCLEQAPLRAADAVHVASALEADADLVVSADRRQCSAARALGLEVEEVALAGP